ncbi:alpha/beta fold hydrolase [Wenzhouxiangella marina]|uniref:Alpha/beta hydrolase fold protein n=1 Tax=Wenzhouxiangella marina TaxID=1579979 RepID=A0A0K0XYS5_9GAMM|nr:alpha/beta fold hydrolase [Wenzhouxiangella marina]AKS42776.1 Alpha/beta hydrolase fold protein [Wenzhouxiangella marina]MBB6087546.1 haloalkane dehalogenase [Wenzhouxiangella marina]
MFSSPLYPYTGQFHEQAGGHRMHYLDEGPSDAQPVVMVHGNPTWSFYYRRLVEDLKPDFRCLVPDHIGMGLSDRPDDASYDYTLSQRLEDLGHWLDAVEPNRPVDLIVHDWGGAIGLSWAVRNIERVRRVVILNTWAFNIPPDEHLPRSLRFARTRLGSFLIQRFNAFSGLAVRMATERKLDREVARAMTGPYRQGVDSRLATLRFVQDIPLSPEDPAWDVLAETERRLPLLADKPVLFQWGAKDFVFDDRVLDIWREKLPGKPIRYYADAGHYVLEDAHESIVPAVRAWLTEAD